MKLGVFIEQLTILILRDVWGPTAFAAFHGKNPHVHTAVVDQCMYDLNDPGSNCFFRKLTRFVGALPGMNDLNKECNINHQHHHVEDSVKVNRQNIKRSQLARQVPKLLCEDLVSLVQLAQTRHHLSRERRALHRSC